MSHFTKQCVSIGVRNTIPNIIQHKVWQGWEKYVNQNEDDVMEVKLSHHLFSKTTQRIAFKQPKKVDSLPTSEIVDQDIIITFFDKEATMMLRTEAENIFGNKLNEYLKA